MAQCSWHWTYNAALLGSHPSPYYCMDLFTVVTQSNPQPCCVNNQLLSLLSVGILRVSFVIYNMLLQRTDRESPLHNNLYLFLNASAP